MVLCSNDRFLAHSVISLRRKQFSRFRSEADIPQAALRLPHLRNRPAENLRR